MQPALRRVLLGFAASLVLVTTLADAQIRPNSRAASKIFRWTTRRVTITVKPSDYDLQTGIATVTVPHAITGFVRERSSPWYVMVRADPFFELKRHGMSTKPCSHLAIRFASGTVNTQFRPLAAHNQLTAVGSSVPEGREDVAFDLRFEAYPEDIEGEYSIELYFQYSD